MKKLLQIKSNLDKIVELKKRSGIYEIGDAVKYNGRNGEITDYEEEDEVYLVYFSDDGSEEWLDDDDLFEETG